MLDRGVGRRYGALEADERFRLELRAAARDDHQEVDRLIPNLSEAHLPDE